MERTIPEAIEGDGRGDRSHGADLAGQPGIRQQEAAAGEEMERCGGGGVRVGWEITPHIRTVDLEGRNPHAR